MPLTAFDRAALDCLIFRERGLAKETNPAARLHADCAAVLERVIAVLEGPGGEEGPEGPVFGTRTGARTMVPGPSQGAENGRLGYQRVWLSEEALKLARERMKMLVECGVADGASLPDHPEHFVWLLARDLGLLPKENG